MISSAGRSASSACRRIASGLERPRRCRPCRRSRRSPRGRSCGSSARRRACPRRRRASSARPPPGAPRASATVPAHDRVELHSGLLRVDGRGATVRLGARRVIGTAPAAARAVPRCRAAIAAGLGESPVVASAAARRVTGPAVAVLVVFAAGCRSSSKGDEPSSRSRPGRPRRARRRPSRAKEAYAKAQAYTLGHVDYWSSKVTGLNPSQTVSSVLAQKVHSLSAATRRAARRLARLDPPTRGRPAASRGRAAAGLRAAARRWVAAHPKATVGDAVGIVHGARRELDHTIDALAHRGQA